MITFNDLTILWFWHGGDETHYIQSVSHSFVRTVQLYICTVYRCHATSCDADDEFKYIGRDEQTKIATESLRFVRRFFFLYIFSVSKFPFFVSCLLCVYCVRGIQECGGATCWINFRRLGKNRQINRMKSEYAEIARVREIGIMQCAPNANAVVTSMEFTFFFL